MYMDTERKKRREEERTLHCPCTQCIDTEHSDAPGSARLARMRLEEILKGEHQAFKPVQSLVLLLVLEEYRR